MGTYYRIKVVDDSSCQIQQESVDRFLALFNQSMSTYIKLSEISQFNQAPPNKAISVSPFLEKALVMSKAVWRDTGGAFDPTIGPIVNLWGFGPSSFLADPSPQQMAQAQIRTGLEKIEIISSEGEPLRLVKERADLYLDMSGIAKGQAVDELALLIEASGCFSYLVDIGGEIKAGGSNLKGKSWRIGIEKPSLDIGQGLVSVLLLQDMGIATSGDYRNFRLSGGEKVSHIIDPRSGEPANNGVISVTVADQSTMRADALATAFMVMGEEESIAFAEENDIPVFLIRKKSTGEVIERYTSTMTNLFLMDPD